MMKFLIICVVSAEILQANRIGTCTSGEVMLPGKEDDLTLTKLFTDEYTSRSNAFWNTMTLNWRYHFKNMHELDTYNLCDCIIDKLRPNMSEIVIGDGVSTAKEYGIDLSPINITKSDIPVISCRIGNSEVFLIEGYKNHGLKKVYDVYALQKKKIQTGVDFLGLVRSVDFKSFTL